MLKGIAFDLDGTLYPNYRLNLRLIPFAAREFQLLSAFGKARNIIRKYQSENPDIIYEQNDFYTHQAEITAKILSVQPEPLKEKIEKLMYRGWEPIFKSVKLFKGVNETLLTLHKAGYKLGLMSDFPPETKLKNLGVPDIWDAVLCSECCGALKPHPMPFIKLAEAMSLPPENILYVGNSLPYDVGGGAKAGMKTAWLTPWLMPWLKPSPGGKKPKPDFLFSNYRQLLKYILQ